MSKWKEKIESRLSRIEKIMAKCHPCPECDDLGYIEKDIGGMRGGDYQKFPCLTCYPARSNTGS